MDRASPENPLQGRKFRVAWGPIRHTALGAVWKSLQRRRRWQRRVSHSASPSPAGDQQSGSNPSRESWVHTSIRTHTRAHLHFPPKSMSFPYFGSLSPISPDEHSTSFLHFSLGPALSTVCPPRLGWFPLFVSLNQVKLKIHLTAVSESSSTWKACLWLLLALWVCDPSWGPLHKWCQSAPPMRGKQRRLRTLTNLHPLGYPALSMSWELLSVPFGLTDNEYGCFTGRAPSIYSLVFSLGTYGWDWNRIQDQYGLPESHARTKSLRVEQASKSNWLRVISLTIKIIEFKNKWGYSTSRGKIWQSSESSQRQSWDVGV